MTELIKTAIDMILHMDAHLNQGVALLGPWMYVVLFAVIFCETGLVITPFLPGDSLLFALGALAASDGSVLSLQGLAATLIVAGILGDATNYSIGRYLGPKVFASRGSRFLNPQHLHRTQAFYDKHGGKRSSWPALSRSSAHSRRLSRESDECNTGVLPSTISSALWSGC